MEPKILFFDVETKPVRCWTFSIGRKVTISHENICYGDSFDIICICYKWAHENKIHSLDWGIKTQNSGKMIESFSKVLAEADMVVGHNADRFDIRQINTQRLLHGQEPIMWPECEDTLKQFKKYFALPSYKLDYLGRILTGSGKDKMVLQDWVDIVENKDKKALDKMIRYCKKDVLKLQEIYNSVYKYVKPKIHAGVLAGKVGHTCPRCGSDQLQSRGTGIRRVGRVKRFQCKDCGSWSQATILKSGNLGVTK